MNQQQTQLIANYLETVSIPNKRVKLTPLSELNSEHFSSETWSDFFNDFLPDDRFGKMGINFKLVPTNNQTLIVFNGLSPDGSAAIGSVDKEDTKAYFADIIEYLKSLDGEGASTQQEAKAEQPEPTQQEEAKEDRDKIIENAGLPTPSKVEETVNENTEAKEVPLNSENVENQVEENTEEEAENTEEDGKVKQEEEEDFDAGKAPQSSEEEEDLTGAPSEQEIEEETSRKKEKVSEKKKKEIKAKKEKAAKDNAQEDNIDAPNFDDPIRPIKEQDVEFKLQCSQLKNILTKAIKGTAKSGVMPMFECIAFHCSEGTLTIKSDIREIAIVQTILCDGEFDFAIHGKTLLSVIKNMSGILSCQIKNDILTISNKKTTVKLEVKNYSEFPLLITVTKKNPCSFVADVPVRDAMKKALNYVSGNSSRPELCGVNIKTDKDQNRVIIQSTDNTSVYHNGVTKSVSCNSDVIIPADSLNLALNVFGDSSFNINIYDGVVIMSNNGGLKVYAKLTEEQFIDIDGMFPKTVNYQLSVNKQSLVNACKLLKVVCDLDIPYFTMDIAGSIATLSTQNEKGNESTKTIIEGVKSTKPSFMVSLSMNSVMKSLDICEDHYVTFSFVDAEHPFYVRSENSTDKILLTTVVVTED